MGLLLPSPVGPLEAILEEGAASPPSAVAVLCHPHPQYGGTMNNKVIVRAAQAFREAGLATLRFNFRGVGKSAGTFDFGEGEQEDVAAALAFMAERYPGIPIWIAGYSFGAWVGLRVGARDERVTTLVAIGAAVALADFRFLEECAKPKLFIQGTKDEFAPLEHVQALMLTLPEPKELILIEGADHFFTGKLEELKSELLRYVTTHRPQ
jgi:alpha/beta superfamily hydrolase